MCTVTYIPQENNGFILTSNRDESAVRSPQNLTQIEVGNIELIFPRDTAAGGTWIALSNTNKMVCVLNGAFEKHQHRPPYRRSRGLMALDFFQFKNTDAFFYTYEWEGMEPFTMVIYDATDLYELRWDGQELFPQRLDTKGYYLWSSATLYSPESRKNRQGWFQDWLLDRVDFSLEAIQQFHQEGGKGDTWNGFIMNRMDLVQTVSMTNIVKTETQMKMIYNDLLRIRVKEAQLSLKTVIPTIQG